MSFCGLDFGTSNSAIGVGGKKTHLVPLEGGNEIIPSAIFYNTEDEHQMRIHFGKQALMEYIDGYEGRLMRSLKSLLGTSLIHEKTQIGRRAVSFAEILKNFLKHLKVKAEQHSKQELTHIVCGRPVFFIDGDEKADKSAQDFLEKLLHEIGYSHVKFLYEPVAAAMDYEKKATSEQLAMIVDIGGGTSDFSIIKTMPKGYQKLDRSQDILANHGVHIGGNDFDRVLNLHSVMPHLGYGSHITAEFDASKLSMPSNYFHDLAMWQKINFLYTEMVKRNLEHLYKKSLSPNLLQRFLTIVQNHDGHRLAIDIEETKIELTDLDVYNLDLAYIEKGWSLNITKQDFEASMKELVHKISQTIQETINLAGVKTEDIKLVFLTGGGTAVPIVQETVKSMLPNATYETGNQFSSIASGLTEYAQYAFK